MFLLLPSDRVKPPFVVELLGAHDREGFSCGSEVLDRYFRSQVTQDIRRRVTSCFAAIDSERNIVAGFYTIAAASTWSNMNNKLAAPTMRP